MSRQSDLVAFYELLDRLAECTGGPLTLAACDGRMPWPQRGVYFFFEESETRSHSGEGLRVVRVGTHALRAGSGTGLWNRLSQHRGVGSSGGGNHRGSIFRLLVGTAITEPEKPGGIPSWGVGADPGKAAGRLGLSREQVREIEKPIEAAVSARIRAMPFLWLDVDDPSGPDSLRGVIERNSVALLSNFERPALDPASASWLGNACDRQRVRGSGLWNNNHVDEAYDPEFLTRLADRIGHTRPVG